MEGEAGKESEEIHLEDGGAGRHSSVLMSLAEDGGVLRGEDVRNVQKRDTDYGMKGTNRNWITALDRKSVV